MYLSTFDIDHKILFFRIAVLYKTVKIPAKLYANISVEKILLKGLTAFERYLKLVVTASTLFNKTFILVWMNNR